MMKRKIVLFILLLVCFVTMLQSNRVLAGNTIMLNDSEYNAKMACWDFTIKGNSNDKIYYTYKDEKLDNTCDYIKSGSKISVPASLIKNSYSLLKLCTYRNGKQYNYRIYNIANISRNTYINQLRMLCGNIFDVEDNDYTRAKKLYTWIGENCIYEYDGLTNNEYNAFYGRIAACSGFARLYKDMCMIAGLRCEYVSEETVDYKYKEWHAWNHLYLDNQLFIVDPTWSGVCFNNKVDYSHFCNNAIVNYVITDKYDLSSEDNYE